MIDLSHLQVQIWPVDRLLPYIRNARTHSDDQVAQIASSIREFGWTNPLLVAPDGVMIAGHARLLAARKAAPGESAAVPRGRAHHHPEACSDARQHYRNAQRRVCRRAGSHRPLRRALQTLLRRWRHFEFPLLPAPAKWHREGDDKFKGHVAWLQKRFTSSRNWAKTATSP